MHISLSSENQNLKSLLINLNDIALSILKIILKNLLSLILLAKNIGNKIFNYNFNLK
jgi:hypothetical protein